MLFLSSNTLAINSSVNLSLVWYKLKASLKFKKSKYLLVFKVYLEKKKKRDINFLISSFLLQQTSDYPYMNKPFQYLIYF